jgi:hypothetical protein
MAACRRSLSLCIGLLCVPVFAALPGCIVSTQYRVKASQPWPDEWVSGARVPYTRLVQLDQKTVEWHRKANWGTLESQITSMLSQRRDLYGFVRGGRAESPTDDASPGLRYLEVKVGPCFFDFERDPPAVTLNYENTPFKEVVADLMKRAGRSYVISPRVSKKPAITGHLVDLDWREAAVRIMLEADVFVEPVWYNPVALRSYEYTTQGEFVAAVRQLMETMGSTSPGAPLTIVPWAQWVKNNVAYQLRYDAALRARPTSQQFGPPPGTAILSSDLAVAKKQVLYALPYQINRPKKGSQNAAKAGRGAPKGPAGVVR